MLRIIKPTILFSICRRSIYDTAKQLYKITTITTSSVQQPVLTDLFRKNIDSKCKCIRTRLYTGAHTCTPVLECEYHINETYANIEASLTFIVTDEKVRKSIGFMDYDIDIVMREN